MQKLIRLRIALLTKYWNEVQVELIRKYKSMGSKHKLSVVLIERIQENIKKKALKDYYKNYRDEYLKKLRVQIELKSIHNKDSKEYLLSFERSFSKVIKSQPKLYRAYSLANENMIKNIALSHMKKKIHVAAKPKFEYMPSNEEMSNLILRTAGIS